MPLFDVASLLGISQEPERKRAAAAALAPPVTPVPPIQWRPSEEAQRQEVEQKQKQQQFGDLLNLAQLQGTRENQMQNLALNLGRIYMDEYQAARQEAGQTQRAAEQAALTREQMGVTMRGQDIQAKLAEEQNKRLEAQAAATMARQDWRDQFDVARFINDVQARERTFAAEQAYRQAQLNAKDVDDIRQEDQVILNSLGRLAELSDPTRVPVAATPQEQERQAFALATAVQTINEAQARKQSILLKSQPPPPSLDAGDLEQMANQIINDPKITNTRDAMTAVSQLRLSPEQKRGVGSFIMRTEKYKTLFNREAGREVSIPRKQESPKINPLNLVPMFGPAKMVGEGIYGLLRRR